MALYNLPNGVDVKVWPDANVALIGQTFWTVDNVLATSRVTGTITAQTVVATANVGMTAFGLAGGDTTNISMAVRHFNAADVLQSQSGNTIYLDRDVDFSAINVAMIMIVASGDYIDLAVQQDGVVAGLTNVDITTRLQFWTLDFAL